MRYSACLIVLFFITLCSTGAQAQDFVLQESARRTSPIPTLNLERLEQEAIERAMQIAGGNVTRAAELLGITRFALYRKLNK